MEANEKKRKEYEERIKDTSPEKLVYIIDESGIDTAICQDRGWGKKGEKLARKKSGK